jgi:hypothetical protein
MSAFDKPVTIKLVSGEQVKVPLWVARTLRLA